MGGYLMKFFGIYGISTLLVLTQVVFYPVSGKPHGCVFNQSHIHLVAMTVRQCLHSQFSQDIIQSHLQLSYFKSRATKTQVHGHRRASETAGYCLHRNDLHLIKHPGPRYALFAPFFPPTLYFILILRLKRIHLIPQPLQ
jgi:hypothetical protein